MVDSLIDRNKKDWLSIFGGESMHSIFIYFCCMKNLYFILLIILFTACGIKDCDECPQWQECAMVGEPFSNKYGCRPVLKKYNGYWTGTQTIVDYLGNSTTNTLTDLMSQCIDPELSHIHFNSNYPKYILFNYPLSSYDFSIYNDIQLDDNLNKLLLEFLNPNSGNFIVNDSIYDPSVNSVVVYQGSGRIIQYNSSVNSITLEFDCSYEFDGHSNFVTFSATSAY